MTSEQRALLHNRLISIPIKYHGIEPTAVRIKEDQAFCESFFGSSKIDLNTITVLFDQTISCRSEIDLDYLLMLITHFNLTLSFDLQIAPLLIQPWHHFHDNIAEILEFDRNPQTANYLYLGATYTCENLDYESDYRGFSIKCLYALLKIGTPESLQYIKKLAASEHIMVSEYAKKILSENKIV